MPLLSRGKPHLKVLRANLRSQSSVSWYTTQYLEEYSHRFSPFFPHVCQGLRAFDDSAIGYKPSHELLRQLFEIVNL